MRIALAAIFQLTNTFAPQQTTLDDFIIRDTAGFEGDSDDPFGVARLVRETVAEVERSGHSVEPVLSAVGRTGGPIAPDALDELAEDLSDRLSELTPQVDALILIMSGAALSGNGESAEDTIVAASRAALQPGTPIVALFCPEARLTENLLDSLSLALVIDGQADDLEAAVNALPDVVERLRNGEIHPVSKLRRLPMLLSYGARVNGAHALNSLRNLAAEFSNDSDVLGATVIPGFPFVDVADAGTQVLVTTDDDPRMAAQLAERLKSAVWDVREEFDCAPLNVETVVHEAMLSEQQPVVIFDAGDDPAAGASGDGTGLLWALIDLGAPDAALGVIVDPAAVIQSIEAGIGATLQFDIGGGVDRRAGYPVNITATVRNIAEDLPTTGNYLALAGRVVLLDVEGRHGGRIDVIVTERAPLSVDPTLFGALGVDLGSKRIVGVKSSGQNRGAYSTIASQILETSTPGITTPSLGYLEFQHVSRPMFPLDDAVQSNR